MVYRAEYLYNEKKAMTLRQAIALAILTLDAEAEKIRGKHSNEFSDAADVLRRVSLRPVELGLFNDPTV